MSALTTSLPVATKQEAASNSRQRYEHLSKKTRIELVGSEHNYNLRCDEEPPGRRQVQQQVAEEAGEAVEGALEAGAQHMDDCMAAMVLMFLSCRPGEQVQVQAPQPQQVQQVTQPHSQQQVASQKPQTSSAKAKRNSEPIEMDTSSQQKLYQRQHFKRRLFAHSPQLEPEEECSWKARRRRLNQAPELEEHLLDEEEELQRSSSASSSTSGVHSSCKLDVEDEMIFELQQVDESGSECAEQPSLKAKRPADSGLSLSNQERLFLADLRQARCDNRQQAEQERLNLNLNLKLKQQEQQQPHLMQHQLRFRMSNPVKTRTVFSCMWPSCTKNCDLLEDIERHVRAHLGPKQCDSIGDEDFYYEETEVDEQTYLAIFGPSKQVVQVQHNSPSHNSDGLSSGHSFSSSSPATSPVCSTDSSSSSSSSSSTSSSASSGSSSYKQLYANSIDWSHFLGGGGGGGRGNSHLQRPRYSNHLHYQSQPSVGQLQAQSAVQRAAPSASRASPPASPASSSSALSRHHHLLAKEAPPERPAAPARKPGRPPGRPALAHSQQVEPAAKQGQSQSSGLNQQEQQPQNANQNQNQNTNMNPSMNLNLNRNNHLKHNLSQRFFHNQSTSSSASRNGNHTENPLQVAQTHSPSIASKAAPVQLSRRVRGENRKCRKVYGMERRDLWCTQCKWKKACSRFCDQ